MPPSIRALCLLGGVVLSGFAALLGARTIEIHVTWLRAEGVVVAIPAAMARVLSETNGEAVALQGNAHGEAVPQATIEGVARPIVQFTDASGVVRRTASVVGTELPSLQAVGDVVSIAYSPRNPYESCVASTADEWATPVVLFGAGVLLLSVPRLAANRLRFASRSGCGLAKSRNLEALGFALAVLGPPIAGISPGPTEPFQIGMIVALLIVGMSLLLVQQIGTNTRSPFLESLPVTVAAVAIELLMLDRIVVAESRQGVLLAALVFGLGVGPLARPGVGNLRRAGGVGLTALSVVTLAICTVHALRTPGDVPPFPLMVSLIGLATGTVLCGDLPLPVARAGGFAVERRAHALRRPLLAFARRR